MDDETMTNERALTVQEPHDLAPAKLFAGNSGAEIVELATEIADSLSGVVEKKKLYTTISGRKHVRVEGWTLLGSLVGVFPVCVWTRPLTDPEGWEARVEARTLDGKVVGASEAQCTRKENTWRTRDDYALRSMAQTRATSKAMRQPLGFIVTLAGYDATPSEEIPDERPANKGRQQTPRQAPADSNVVDGEYTEVKDEPERFGTANESINDLLSYLVDHNLAVGDVAGALPKAPEGRDTVKGRLEAYARANPEKAIGKALVAMMQEQGNGT